MKLLLVEDNVALAENLAEVFRDLGHEVVLAEDGASAVTCARDGFDLALLDVRLPDAHGTALLPRLKELARDAEVIVTTGNADLASAIEAVRGGAFAYLTKPVDVEELVRTAARALERVQLRNLSRELQERLERSERRHREMLQAVPALIVALDAELRIRFANRALEELSGYPLAELEGLDFLERLLPPAEHAASRRLLASLAASEAREQELALVRRDGSLRRVHLRWTGRPPGEGVGRLVGTGLDVTRQRELEHRARVSHQLAAVGTLAAGLAHEIRNPLNAAGLQLSLLARRIGRLPESERGALSDPLHLVREELARLDGLLGDFLSFARPRDYGRFPVELSRVAERVVALEREAACAAGRTLVADLAQDLRVRGDGDALQQVLLNVLRNALEASRHDLRVSLAREGDRVVFTVSDDGPGIPPEAAARIFEPFFTTKQRGTGLGLSIVHTIVTAHRGEVTLAPRPGGGTTARISLPELQEEPEEAPA